MRHSALKILIVDTNIAALPILKAAKELGAEVHVVGGNKNDFLCSISDQYWELDYSDVDSLSNLIEEQSFDYVVPGCNDQSYLSCMSLTDAATRLGYESLSNTISLNDKSEFRAICNRIGLTSPKKFNLKEIKNLEILLIVKPVDSFSGKGVTTVDSSDPDALAAAIDLAKKHSTSSKYVIEEFIDGQMFSHSAFIEDGQIKKDFFVIEDSVSYAFAVDTSTCVSSSDVPEFGSLVIEIEKLIKELELCNGLLHTQFIVSGDRAYIIEATKRCPGDLYSHLIELSTGYPYAKAYLYGFLGREITHSESTHSFVIRHTLTAKQHGSFIGIQFKNGSDNVELYHLIKSGERCEGISYTRIGLMFIELGSKSEMTKYYSAFLSDGMYRVLVN